MARKKNITSGSAAGSEPTWLPELSLSSPLLGGGTHCREDLARTAPPGPPPPWPPPPPPPPSAKWTRGRAGSCGVLGGPRKRASIPPMSRRTRPQKAWKNENVIKVLNNQESRTKVGQRSRLTEPQHGEHPRQTWCQGPSQRRWQHPRSGPPSSAARTRN